MSHYFVYITKNSSTSSYLVQLTNDLKRSVSQMKQIDEYTGSGKLLYYEHYTELKKANSRLNELKNLALAQMAELIKSANPHEEDLGALFV